MVGGTCVQVRQKERSGCATGIRKPVKKTKDDRSELEGEVGPEWWCNVLQYNGWRSYSSARTWRVEGNYDGGKTLNGDGVHEMGEEGEVCPASGVEMIVVLETGKTTRERTVTGQLIVG